MFDFENLDVYKKAKKFNRSVADFLAKNPIDKVTHNQLRRAAFSVILNIAEGSGRYTRRDKRNFYIIARGSVFECAAVCDYVMDTGLITNEVFQSYYQRLEELSKILFALIKGLE